MKISFNGYFHRKRRRFVHLQVSDNEAQQMLQTK